MQLDIGITTAELKDVPNIDKIINTFEKWTESNVKSNSGSRRDITMPTLGDKSDQPKNDNKDKKKTTPKGRTCLCGDTHLFQDCPYVNNLKTPKDWNPDLDITEKFDQLE